MVALLVFKNLRRVALGLDFHNGAASAGNKIQMLMELFTILVSAAKGSCAVNLKAELGTHNVVRLSMTNSGPDSVAIVRRRPDKDFYVLVKDHSGHVVRTLPPPPTKDQPFNQRQQIRRVEEVLKPGDSVSEEVPLNTWLSHLNSGSYQLTINRSMHCGDRVITATAAAVNVTTENESSPGNQVH